MSEIQTLIETRKAYINSQADKIVNEMVRRNVTTDTLSTCDYPNWDRELHRSMPDIIKRLTELGIRTTSKVNHGVTDYVFTVII